MDLKVFDGQEKSELSMIEVAHAILAYHNEAMAFADLTNEIQQYLGKSDEEIRERLSQFYTDLNVDGSFISLGDNTWGLRAWYPYESIDEATVGETEEDRPKKRRRKVNAFLAGTDDDDDVIDYDNDDPEDEDLDDDQGPDDDDDYEEDDYDEDNPVEDDDEETNIEDQLSELHGDEFGDDEEEDEEDKEDDEE